MSWQDLKKLKEDRAAAIGEAREIINKAKSEDRGLTDDETQQVEMHQDEADRLGRKINILEREAQFEGNQAASDQDSHIKQQDVRNYSFLRAIRQLMNGKRVDGLEGELSQECAKRNGRDPQGFYVPRAALTRADLTLSTGSGAKASDEQPGFIELLRAKMVTQRLGARVMTGLQGDLSIPKTSAGGTAYWFNSESSDIDSDSSIAIGQVGLSPNSVGAYQDFSRKFLLQSTIDAEQFVREELASALAIAIDEAAIQGSGSGAEPEGITEASNTGSVSASDNEWQDIVDLEGEVEGENVVVTAGGYITTPSGKSKLKGTTKDSGSGQFIWQDNEVNGYPALATTLVPTGTDTANVIFGNWVDLVIGMWGDLDVNIDRVTNALSGGVRVVAIQDADVALRHPESFAILGDLSV